MIRYLSAIGMSRCITVKAASRLVQHFLQHPQNEPALVRDPSSGDHLVELVWSMDHFGLVLRGRISAPGQVEVHELMPAILDFAEGQRLEDWEVVSTDRRTPVLFAVDPAYDSTIDLIIQRLQRLPSATPRPESIVVGSAALSVSGKILLAVTHTAEDEAAWKEEDALRRSLARRLRQGDRSAERELREEEDALQEDVLDRLDQEDVYTILEGLMDPIDEATPAYYHVLGTIRRIRKILNPFSEEWVYQLSLDVMGSPCIVYINPKDLAGEPAVGRRFLGPCLMVGDILS